MTDDYHTTERQPDGICLLMEGNSIYKIALNTQLSNLNLPKTFRPNCQLTGIIRDRGAH